MHGRCNSCSASRTFSSRDKSSIEIRPITFVKSISRVNHLLDVRYDLTFSCNVIFSSGGVYHSGREPGGGSPGALPQLLGTPRGDTPDPCLAILANGNLLM